MGDDLVVTPVDPTAGGDDEVVRFGKPRRRPPAWWLAVAAVLAGGLVAGLLVSRGGSHQKAAPPPPSPSQAAPVPTKAVDLVLGAHGVYVLYSDGTVTRLDGGTLLGNETVPAAPADASMLFVDEAAQRSWEINPSDPSTVQVTAKLPSLTVTHLVTVPGQVFGAALFDGKLWLAAMNGLFALGPQDPVATRVPGYDGGAYAIAADPYRDRLVAVSLAYPAHVIAVRPGSSGATLLTESPLPLAKATIAVTAEGVWIGGYASGGAPRVVRLDPVTLRPSGASTVQVGPGAAVWPGESVVWVHAGDGSNQLYCVDAATGRELARWPNVNGPVVSRRGAAYAIVNGQVQRLVLPATCPG